MRLLPSLLLKLFLLPLLSPWLAGETEGNPVEIPDSQRVEMLSQSTGKSYYIDIAWPAETPPSEGWPVLYVLDGSRTFPMATSLARALSINPMGTSIDQGIIVGIGYTNTDWEFTRDARAEDYTLEGAEAFQSFIEEEVKPFIEANYPVDSKRQTLFGHSYGGLFATHILFTQPQSYQSYLIASPSLWWNEEAVFVDEPQFAEKLKHLETKPSLLISSAQYEQELAPHHKEMPNAGKRIQVLEKRAMVDNARSLASRLQALGLDCQYRNFSDANHGNAAPFALVYGLPIAFPYPTSSKPDAIKPTE